MTLVEAQYAFYQERVPDQFNLILEHQKTRALGDASAARVLEEMEAVRTSIVVQVDRGDAIFETAFDIERGRMNQVDDPARSPFLILAHTLEDFENIRHECGDSLLGFLGALAGLDSPMRLTSLRVRNLRDLHGSLAFHRVGRNGFSLLASFGVDQPEAQPRTTIRLNDAVYTALRSGGLDPQDAFLDGRIEVEGDMEMAVGLALAALSPD
jgi:hypothetical protein